MKVNVPHVFASGEPVDRRRLAENWAYLQECARRAQGMRHHKCSIVLPFGPLDNADSQTERRLFLEPYADLRLDAVELFVQSENGTPGTVSLSRDGGSALCTVTEGSDFDEPARASDVTPGEYLTKDVATYFEVSGTGAWGAAAGSPVAGIAEISAVLHCTRDVFAELGADFSSVSSFTEHDLDATEWNTRFSELSTLITQLLTGRTLSCSVHSLRDPAGGALAIPRTALHLATGTVGDAEYVRRIDSYLVQSPAGGPQTEQVELYDQSAAASAATVNVVSTNSTTHAKGRISVDRENGSIPSTPTKDLTLEWSNVSGTAGILRAYSVVWSENK